MKVFVKFPEDEQDISEFENRIANFHSTLLLNKIQTLNITDKTKKLILKEVTKELHNKII